MKKIPAPQQVNAIQTRAQKCLEELMYVKDKDPISAEVTEKAATEHIEIENDDLFSFPPKEEFEDCHRPLPITASGRKYLITAIYLASKCPDAVFVSDITSMSVIDALLQIFSRMGFPKEIQHDQGHDQQNSLNVLELGFYIVQPTILKATQLNGSIARLDEYFVSCVPKKAQTGRNMFTPPCSL
ncbi:hypothetical protein AVEN_121317-1 [Araneus ventricosus]|uniref:Integrase catalytic domain-containing protein n=1 Tax=Araneus ventricosus TaxID=182803 RepID=A0A4Y2JET4_ARAVE|nr:hypothetical protein AVEN_121317-1 [Araneus ventricosus]